MTQSFGNPRYGLSRKLGKVDLQKAREAVEASLKQNGFGVLTEIDVSATLKKKIDVDFRPYLILGACNPTLAHQALEAELPIGLLLPCNVILTVDDDGDVIVSAVDPVKMFESIQREEIEPMAEEVQQLLKKSVDGIQLD